MKKGVSQSFAHALCCPILFFIYFHLPVRQLLWKRVCPKSVRILCVVPYCFSPIFIYLSDRCYEKGFAPKLCTYFVLSHTVFHLSSFTFQTVAMKKGLPWKFALVSCCPIRISVLSTLLCIWITNHKVNISQVDVRSTKRPSLQLQHFKPEPTVQTNKTQSVHQSASHYSINNRGMN